MKNKKYLDKFIQNVRNYKNLLICDESILPLHFEKWIFTPDHERRFCMDKTQFAYFMKQCGDGINFIPCNYAEGLGI